jgi:hypothetical protein
MATPVLADIVAVVSARCGLLLAEAGVYLDGPNGTTAAITEGIARGCKAVGLYPTDTQIIADSDIAYLSTYGLERVKDEAERFALERALLNWWRVARIDQEAVSATPIASGWRLEQKRSVVARVAQLKVICDEPYREPSGPIVVTDPACPPGMTCVARPTSYPPFSYSPFDGPAYYPPYGYGGGPW